MAPTFDNARANGPHLVEAIDRGWVGTVTGNCPWAPVSRLAGIGHDLAGTAADQSFGLSYNPASQIAQRTSSNDSYRSTSAYAVSRAYAVNGLNQYTQAGPATFLYDLNDNLISDGSTSFVYDAENRLVSASGARTAGLSYDPLGRLWQVVGPQRTTRFTYDGDAIIGEWDGVGTLRRRYVHGSDASADDPLFWYDWLWGYNRQPLFADHQGSIVAVADSSGVAWAANGYDSWGIPNANNAGRFGYTGQVWIPELGLWHYKARVYSPTLGRFLQSDPVGYEGGTNLYAYVGNDPVNWSDPSGMLRNCPPGDATCIETPESEEQPGEPPPPSEEEEGVEDIIVTGKRPPIDYNDDNEEFFVISGGQMSPRPMTWRSITCSNGDVHRTGTTSSLPSGANAAHSHGDGLEQHPGTRDDNAATRSAGGVAGMMTSNRSFTIRAFSNGTFRTRQTEGPPLTAAERERLVTNMHNWENRPDPGPSQPLERRVCG